MFTIFYNTTFNTRKCFKYFWFVFLVCSVKTFAQELVPYPYVVHSSSIEFKDKQKFLLNSLAKLEDATLHLLLNEETKLNVFDAIFCLKKLPDHYVVEILNGNFYISGKKKLHVLFNGTKIIFLEGEVLINAVNGKLKLISNTSTKLEFEKDVKFINLKENFFYNIEKNIIETSSKKDFYMDLNLVVDTNVYKRLIGTDSNIDSQIPKTTAVRNKLSKVFCLEGDSIGLINNWYINEDKNKLIKKVLREKYLNTCKEKFANVIDAGEYETSDKNCLYVNNSYCQRVDVGSSINYIRLARLLITGYDYVFIKNPDGTFSQVYDKWFFLSPGKYFFKLGKNLNNSVIYEQKQIELRKGQTSRISDLKI